MVRLRPLLSLSLFSLSLFLLSCDEKIVSIPGPVEIVYVGVSSPSLKFNIFAKLSYDGGYYATLWGDVKNTGIDTLRNLFPRAEIFLSEESLKSGNPVTVAQGELGIFNEIGGWEQRTTLLPSETQQHYTQTQKFVIPANTQYINYLLTFIAK